MRESPKQSGGSSRGMVVATLLFGAAVFGLPPAIWIYSNRVDLIEVPAAWRQVRKIQREVESGGDRAAWLEEAMTRLIRLQRPEFRGEKLELTKLRTREGPPVYFLCYEPAGEDSRDYHRLHNLLDRRGRIIDDEPEGLEGDSVRENHFLDVLEGRSFDRLLVSSCHGGGPTRWYRCFSADSRGLVPHGFVAADALCTPLSCIPDEPSPLDRDRILGLLGSGAPGDLLRALYRIEAGPPGGDGLGEFLLAHADDEIRARAVAVLGPRHAEKIGFLEFLDDPSAAVRLAAVEVIASNLDGWESLIEKLTRDPEPVVALGTYYCLARSSRKDVARPALLELVRSRDFSVMNLDFQELSSPEVAEALTEWIEADIEEAFATLKERQYSYLFDLIEEFRRLASRDLRSLAPRLLDLHRRLSREATHSPGLAAALARIELPETDAYVSGMLARRPGSSEEHLHAWVDLEAILDALLKRENPLEDSPALDSLEELGRGSSIPTGWDDIRLRAAIILYFWGIPGAEETLLELVTAPESRWAESILWWEAADHWNIPALQKLAGKAPPALETTLRQAIASVLE